MEFDRPYSRQEFIRFLKGFLPIDAQLNEHKDIPFYTHPNFATSATRLGSCDSLDLNVYEVNHCSRNDARVGLSKDAFRLIADEGVSRALVIFVPEDSNDNYRFSLVELTLSWDDNDKIKRSYSNPRRYSYYLGKGVAYYTPNKYLNEPGRVLSVEDLQNRFSVDVLTKAFYNELSDWYAWAIKEINFPNDLSTSTIDEEANHIGAIRLITRLIFVWFIKQRGLVPWQFFDESFIRENLIENFNPNAKIDLFYKATDSKYYRAILQNLFFAMLNAPICKEGSKAITERKFMTNRGQHDDNKLMRYRDLFKNPGLFLQLANSTVPFLNGGLFDCLDKKGEDKYYDGFSERKESIARLKVPDYLFFGEEVGRGIDLSEYYGDKNKKKVSARGIIDILKRYNFTVEENMPYDKDISLDPELLGKVFENLLAAYNPETKQTARKQTGSFYTPREIVQYMVDESLVAHLKRTVSDKLELEYRKLLSYSDATIDLTESQKQEIMQSLYNCKILDPACGSGAFPVGILQQMVHILTQIDPDNSRWQKMLFDVAQDESSEVFKNSTETERKEQLDDLYHSFNANFNRPDYSRKLYLIENCIYGVDIQPIAIQISKLRFFISLIIDQKPNNDPTDNFGIRPLPNLEAKFVAANSLIGLKREDGNLFNTKEIIEKEKQLKIAKHKIFGAKTARTKRKYEDQVAYLRSEITSMLVRQNLIGNEQAQQLLEWDMTAQNASSPFFDPEWMFGVKNGFDIVIANPPYGANVSTEDRLYIDKTYNYQDYQPETYMLFIEKGVNLTKENGYLTYIIPNTWISNLMTKKIRKHIFNHTCVSYVLHFYESVFGAVVDTDIIGISMTPSKGNLINLFTKNEDAPLKLFRRVSQQELIDKNGEACTLFVSEKDESIIQKLELIPKLSKYCKITQGCKPFQKGKGKPKQTAEIVKSKPYVSDIHQIDFIPLLRGSLMGRYSIMWDNNYWIKYGEWLAEPRPSANYFAPSKIIIRQTGDSIVATIDERQFVVRDNLYTCLPINDSVSVKTILGLLNSKLLNWYYQTNVNSEVGEALAQIKKGHLIKLPIICDNNEDINFVVDKILLDKKNGLSTEDTESELDKIIFKIHDLTYDEVLIVDPHTSLSREEYESFKL